MFLPLLMATGYSWMESAHGPLAASPRGGGPTHSHTTLLHLNPDPNPTIHTRSPSRARPFASMYASSYHTE
uniref:Uncharacterized protein n=1 Tax=Oryza brachyantha TaxID=4533 RepID=J3MD33_ORYBR